MLWSLEIRSHGQAKASIWFWESSSRILSQAANYYDATAELVMWCKLCIMGCTLDNHCTPVAVIQRLTRSWCIVGEIVIPHQSLYFLHDTSWPRDDHCGCGVILVTVFLVSQTWSSCCARIMQTIVLLPTLRILLNMQTLSWGSARLRILNARHIPQIFELLFGCGIVGNMLFNQIASLQRHCITFSSLEGGVASDGAWGKVRWACFYWSDTWKAVQMDHNSLVIS